jgi:tetratricopeptide (TPR) repeat protein
LRRRGPRRRQLAWTPGALERLILILILAAGPVGGPAAARAGEEKARPERDPAADSEEARKLLDEGTRALDERLYHQAIKSFERARALVPASAMAREGLARALTLLGVEFTNSSEPVQARDAFERALRNAENPVARFGLGYLDFLDQRDGPARDNLERSLAKESDDSRTYKLLALIDYRQGRSAAARAEIERAAKLDPKDREAEAFLKQWSVEEKLSGSLSESSTRHFLVRCDRSIHPDAMREILSTMEGIYESIGRSLGHWPSKRIPVLFLVEKDFYQATGSFHWVGGVYDGQIKVPIHAEDGKPGAERKVLIRTLRHEYTHAVVKDLCPGTPNWLNEGIAQYFELSDAPPPGSGSAQGMGERESREERNRKDLLANREKRIPLEKIPTRMWEISDPGFATWTYLEGLGFVSYLVETHRAFRLRLLLSAYRRDGSLASAFQATYGAPLEALEERWWSSLLAKQSPGQAPKKSSP